MKISMRSKACKSIPVQVYCITLKVMKRSDIKYAVHIHQVLTTRMTSIPDSWFCNPVMSV